MSQYASSIKIGIVDTELSKASTLGMFGWLPRLRPNATRRATHRNNKQIKRGSQALEGWLGSGKEGSLRGVKQAEERRNT